MNSTAGPAESAPTRPPRKRGRRLLFWLIAFGTGVAAFYAEENWRGNRAWQNYRRELEAKGEQLNWEAYIPKPVADDQNFFKAPLMDAWFNRQTKETNEQQRVRSLGAGPARTAFAQKRQGTTFPLLEVQLWPADAPDAPAATCPLEAFTGDSDAHTRSLGLLAERPLLRDPASSEYILGPDPGTPRRVHVKLTAGATRRWLEEKISRFGFKAEPTTETNVVRVTIASAISALDLLAWSDQDQAIFTALEAACQRPHAWIEGDYTDPIGAPIFNFVSVRIVVQALAARAKAQLLLNRPDAALHDLTLVARLMGYLRESGSSIVVGMVYVAIGGLYGDAVAEGLSPGLWAEAELAALEPQMRDLDLLGTYANSLRGGERAAIIHVLEVLGAGRLADSFTSATQAPSLDPFALYLRLAPRGWLSQNLLRYARLHQYALDSIDLARGRVDPRRAEVARTAVEQEVGRWSVYNRVACVVIPNTAKALPVTARNHNLLQQARVVCALVRYRRASGAYPDSLASLVPRYFEKPPLDVMTGQPLKYRRLEGGQFTLYSVGWDVKDDGGKQTGSDEAQGQTGDWVWDRGAR